MCPALASCGCGVVGGTIVYVDPEVTLLVVLRHLLHRVDGIASRQRRADLIVATADAHQKKAYMVWVRGPFSHLARPTGGCEVLLQQPQARCRHCIHTYQECHLD
jgi:hypothetical protein